MNLFIMAVTVVDIFLFSPLQPRAVDRISLPPSVLNVAYRPTDEVLARGTFGEITQRDLFLFLHARGADVSEMMRFALFFSRRGTNADGSQPTISSLPIPVPPAPAVSPTPAISTVAPLDVGLPPLGALPAGAEPPLTDEEWIKKQLTDYITVHYLAGQWAGAAPAAAPAAGGGSGAPAAPDPDAAIIPLLRHFLLYPAAELIWIDKEVIPKVQIDRPDVIHYYRQFEAEFKKKGEYDIRQAFIPAPVGQTEVQRREIITYLERLKTTLADSDDWQGVLLQMQRRRPDILVDYKRPTLMIGDEPEGVFEKSVKELQPGAFSPVIETIEGYYLVKCMKATPPSKTPLAEAEPAIRQTLHERFISNQYNIEIGKLLLKTTYQMYVDRWDFLPPDAPVLAIRDYRINRQDVERLMTNQVYLNPEIFKISLALFATGLLNRELILHRAEKDDYWNDPRWPQGEALANQFVAAVRALHADYQQQFTEETPAGLRRYFDTNPEFFSRTKTLRLVQVIGTLKNPDSYLPTDRMYLVETMKKRLEDFIRQADDVMLAPRQTFRETMVTGGPEATTGTLALELFDPEKFRGLLATFNTREYTFEARDVGYLDVTGLKPLEDVVEGVKPGYFSAAGTFENTAATYYVWDSLSGGQQTFEELIPNVRQVYRIKNLAAIWKKRQEDALFWADVKWSF